MSPLKLDGIAGQRKGKLVVTKGVHQQQSGSAEAEWQEASKKMPRGCEVHGPQARLEMPAMGSVSAQQACGLALSG